MKPAISRHPLQYAILEHLRAASQSLRYRDMKPLDVENDAYNYHLQHLLKQGLIAKNDDRYALSQVGKKYLVDLNPINESGESHRFKMASLCVLIQGEGDHAKLLYQRRARQPFAGNWGIIGGGIKRGELATTAARRRLQEEAGLSARFSLFGLLRKRHFDSADQVYSDILYHLCLSQEYEGELITENQYGRQGWVSIDEAVAIETQQPGGSRHLGGMLAQLRDTPPSNLPLFYLEETYTRDIY